MTLPADRTTILMAGDGEKLLALLNPPAADGGGGPNARPAFILLDLNMPRLDGRETLGLLRRREDLKDIPVIVLSTSSSTDGIARSYESGANSCNLKPSSYGSMVDIRRTLKSYWLETVALPG